MRRTYTIEYALSCTMGNVRRNNEDNFYCDSNFRLDPDSKDEVLLFGSVSSKDNELFAVFDGMGGESCGEIASFIAAQNCKVFCENKSQYQEYLYELCSLLNERIVEETLARSLVLMGTTAAMVQFYKNEIYVLNLGDSKIYKLSKNKLQQISQDHTAPGFSGKAPLTKFLGMPTSERPLSPYIARGSYKNGDIFILCTDGVSDMLKEENLLNLTTQDKPLDVIAKEITELAKENGGIDNATVILCKITTGK